MIGCCGGWCGASALVDTLVDLDTLDALDALVGVGALVPPIWWIWMHCSALVGQVAITDSNMGALLLDPAMMMMTMTKTKLPQRPLLCFTPLHSTQN